MNVLLGRICNLRDITKMPSKTKNHLDYNNVVAT